MGKPCRRSIPGERYADVRGQYFNCLYISLTSPAFMRFLPLLIAVISVPFFSVCRSGASDTEIRHDVKYLAAFASPALVTQDDEKRVSTAFQSKYKSRVVLLRPVTGQAALSLSD